ncbi:MAG: hypothetical protein JRJ09_12630 [Deltaproteobacteria bacterium]|nr:hypothetical protein [Deltaproteobacteria bacterium]
MKDSRDLIEKAFSGVRPERTPLFDLLANDAVIEYFADCSLEGMDDQVAVVQAAGNALDGTRSITTPNLEATMWTDPAGNTRVSDRWTSWLKTPAFSDVDGWASWLRDYVEGPRDNSREPAHLDLTENSPDEERANELLDEQILYNETLRGTVNIHCTPSTAINAILYYMGLDMFSYLWADYRDLLKRWIGVYQRRTLDYIRVAAHHQTSPLAMIYADIAYKNGPMFSRQMFNEMGFFEEVAVICRACHEKDIKIVFHSDGNIMELLDDLAATGIDGLNPIEKAAGMDIYEVRRRCPELTLVGGVDATHLLRSASPEQIRVETRKIIDEVGPEGRLLIGSSTEVGNDIPLENYLALHQEAMRS